MTAVASPPSFHQPMPRSAWTPNHSSTSSNSSASSNASTASALHTQMTPDDVTRMFMPRSKSSGHIPTTSTTTSSTTNNSSSSSAGAPPTSSSQNTTTTTTANGASSGANTSASSVFNHHQLPPRPSSSASSISSNSSISTTGSSNFNGLASNSTSTPASSNPSPGNSEPNTPIHSNNNTATSGWGAANGVPSAGKRKAQRNGGAGAGVGAGRDPGMKNGAAGTGVMAAGMNGNGNGSYLMLLPLNGTFERKVIPLPFYPDILRIGRQTNAKTVPTTSNGYFDSKVLSRQHAEVWAEKGSGRVYIRDVKSSNGTFVNGSRLSPENRESEPHEIRAEDILELGIDIVGEDNKTIVHHKVAARVQHAGFHQVQQGAGDPRGGQNGMSNGGMLSLAGLNGNNGQAPGAFDLNFGDIDPIVGGGLMAPPLNHVQGPGGPGGGRGRSNSQTSRNGAMGFLPNGLMGVPQRPGNPMMATLPVTMEAIVKKINYELQQARQQSAELKKAGELFDLILSHKPKVEDIKVEAEQPEPAEEAAVLESTQTAPADSQVEEKAAELPIPVEQIEQLTETKLPKNDPPSQILSLIAVLANTKRDLEEKSKRVKELEDDLSKEREAREQMEGRIGELEVIASKAFTPEHETDGVKTPEWDDDDESAIIDDDDDNVDVPDVREPDEHAEAPEPVEKIAEVETKLNFAKLEADLKDAQAEIEALKQSLQTAKTEHTTTENTLAETLADKKKEEEARVRAEKALEKARKKAEKQQAAHANGSAVKGTATPTPVANGAASKSESPVRAKDGVAAVVQQTRDDRDVIRKASPLIAAIGVVVLGVSVMHFLNTWRGGDKA